jgi:flagellar basal-body rod modification protein FlgD
MGIESVLSAQEKIDVTRLAEEHNHRVNQGRNPGKSLGKDDFIKILITQLSYQNPMEPMEDKEFIAQMAQFSTLEQMTNMSEDFKRLSAILSGGEAAGALGKPVELYTGEETIQGQVKAVTREGVPRVLVNGTFYDWNQVTTVYEE